MTRRMADLAQDAQGALLALLDLGLPARCAACDACSDVLHGTASGSTRGGDGSRGGPVCPTCATQLRQGLFAGPRLVAPHPAPPGLPAVVAAGPYDGVLRQLVTAYKDEERRDLRPVLSALLATALAVVLDAVRRAAPGPPWLPVTVVAVPSSPAAVRRRGDDPVLDLVRAAARARAPDEPDRPAVAVSALLRTTRRMADQSRLDHRQRAANLAGAYEVGPRARAAAVGCQVVLVDDVVTTGSTLAEAARAVEAAGGVVLAAAVLAATQRRRLGSGAGGVRAAPGLS